MSTDPNIKTKEPETKKADPIKEYDIDWVEKIQSGKIKVISIDNVETTPPPESISFVDVTVTILCPRTKDRYKCTSAEIQDVNLMDFLTTSESCYTMVKSFFEAQDPKNLYSKRLRAAHDMFLGFDPSMYLTNPQPEPTPGKTTKTVGESHLEDKSTNSSTTTPAKVEDKKGKKSKQFAGHGLVIIKKEKGVDDVVPIIETPEFE